MPDYRITYNYSDGKRRQTVARFVALETDPVVVNPDTGQHDKVALHFVLTTNIVYDLARTKEYVIEAPEDEPVHFHVWPEDLLNLEAMPMGDA